MLFQSTKSAMILVFVSGFEYSVIAAEFIPIGRGPLVALSADGTVAVGALSGERREASRWTSGTGRIGLDPEDVHPFSFGTGLSDDGGTVVGLFNQTSTSPPEAFIWTETSGFQGLGFLGSYIRPDGVEAWGSQAYAASADGRVVVGESSAAVDDDGFGQVRPFRWTQETGMVEIGTDNPSPRTAVGVSADGRVVFGGGADEGFIWTEESGTMLLPRISGNATSPHAISADGTTVVGGVRNESDRSSAFYWTSETGVVMLPMLPGQVDASAYAVSKDGSVIVGLAGFGAGDLQDGPFIWDGKTGEVHLLAEVLIDLGLGDQIADHNFRQVWDVSADGLTILGDSTGGNGTWLVSLDRLPRYGDFNNDGELSINDIDLLISQLGHPKDRPGFDLNRDQIIDELDLEHWIVESFNSYFGDSNLDGEFNSRDFVLVFQAGQYEDDLSNNSTWESGDWNGDGDFTSGDLVFAFQHGGYEKGRRGPAISIVPEPYGSCVLLCGGGIVFFRRRNDRPLRCYLGNRFVA